MALTPVPGYSGIGLRPEDWLGRQSAGLGPYSLVEEPPKGLFPRRGLPVGAQESKLSPHPPVMGWQRWVRRIRRNLCVALGCSLCLLCPFPHV